MGVGALARAPAVFVDRDGVLNRSAVRDGKPYAPRRLEEFRLLPGVAAAVADLKAAGLLVIVVTNQPDIGNGLVEATVVEAMHARLAAKAPVDEIRVCPHSQSAGCDCRKPRPGMLLAAAEAWNVDLAESYMVGDRAGDVVAGRAAGCYTVFVDRNYRETPSLAFDAKVRSFPEAARAILRHRASRSETI